MAHPRKELSFRIPTSVVVACIALFGSIASALITARLSVPGEVSSALDRRFPNLRLSDIRSGNISPSIDTKGYELATVTSRNAQKVLTPREYLSHITFTPPFTDPPQIILAINSLDASHQHNIRYLVYAQNIDERGADVDIKTWSDTQINSISVDWLAYQTQQGISGKP